MSRSSYKRITKIRIFTLAIMLSFSLTILGTSSTYYLEVYKAIYRLDISVKDIEVKLLEEEGKGEVEITFAVNNPSIHSLLLVGAEGRLFINNKYLALIHFYTGGGVRIPGKVEGFIVKGVAMVEEYRFNLLKRELRKPEVEWSIEAWFHIKVGKILTIRTVRETKL